MVESHPPDVDVVIATLDHDPQGPGQIVHRNLEVSSQEVPGAAGQDPESHVAADQGGRHATYSAVAPNAATTVAPCLIAFFALLRP